MENNLPGNKWYGSLLDIYDMKTGSCSLKNINVPVRTVVLIIAVIMSLSWNKAEGQKKCNNPPAVRLSSDGSTTCALSPVTVSQNTFGGSATSVSLTHNGHGYLFPSYTDSSPFSFTYEPAYEDSGRDITITVTTDNPIGSPCKAAVATYVLSIISGLPAPEIANISQPTCTTSTGSVALSGLPDGEWTLTVHPDETVIDGSGNTYVISGLPQRTYTFTVSSAGECDSPPSEPAVILNQPPTPSPPVPGTVTGPTCTVPTGSVFLSGLPSDGGWSLTRYPGTAVTNGTGATTTVSGIPPGTYNFTVTSETGCTSLFSASINIPDPPSNPGKPVISSVTQPTFSVPTGSVTLTGLPAAEVLTIIRIPDNVGYTGSGPTMTITGLEDGAYTFLVRDINGCTSEPSDTVRITTSNQPLIVITDPPRLCSPATADLTAPDIIEGSTTGLIFTYWVDEDATISLDDPEHVTGGTYYIKGSTPAGYFDLKPVIVTISDPPAADAGPDQVLPYQFSTVLDAVIGDGETGRWFADSSYITFSDVTSPVSTVNNLADGDNILLWIVTNDVCPADTDRITISVGELVIPTLITPNGDAANEYFVIKGLKNIGKTELTIFDRRGLLVFHSNNYDNKWNGVDNNNNPLLNDTYFYLLKSSKGKSYNGYIVVRR